LGRKIFDMKASLNQPKGRLQHSEEGMFLAIWHVTCPVSYFGLALYLREINSGRRKTLIALIY